LSYTKKMNIYIKIVTLIFLTTFILGCKPEPTETWLCSEDEYVIKLEFYNNNLFYSSVTGDCHRQGLYVLFDDKNYYEYEMMGDSTLKIIRIGKSSDVSEVGDFFIFEITRQDNDIFLRYRGINPSIDFVRYYHFKVLQQ